MTNLQRTILRVVLLACLFAGIGNQDLFAQALNITTPNPLPDGVVGTAYSLTFAATGGIGPRTWSLDSGSLPGGLSLSAAGVLSGTPTTAATSNFRIRVQTALDNDEMNFNLRISTAVSISTGSPLPPATQGIAYSQSLAALGGVSPYSWSISTGTLPSGLTLSPAGLLSGTPTGSGNSSFTVQVSDASSPAQTLTKALTLTVFGISSTTPLPPGTTGTAYSQTLSAAGGTAPYTWSLATGSLPGGLTLSSAGLISGTPTAAGTANFTVRATDSSTPALTVTKSFSLEIILALSITTATPLPSGMPGVAYSQTLTATGGTAPYAWSITTGTLPAGLTRTGATISGTPSSAGSSTFTVQVSDASSPVRTSQKIFTLDIVLPLIISTATPLPPGSVGVAYSQSFSAAGGLAPYGWTVTGGTLPGGLTLSAAGLLSGTPTGTGTSNFTVRVVDGTTPPQNFSKAFALTINAALTITTASPLPPAVTGTAYSQSLAASGGSTPYTWSIATGSSLPAGLTLSAAGLLSGTPTSAGTSNFTVQVTDSGSPVQTTTKPFTLVVGTTLVITTPSPLPDATPGVFYTQTLAAAGGSTPYTWSIAAGSSLPGGLTLSAAGVLSGTPTTAGSANFTLRVADSSTPTQSATKAFTLAIGAPISITTGSPLPDGAVSMAYSQTLAAAGGTAPFSWSFVTGSLPGGITLSANGVIAGIPTQTGLFSFTILVTDSSSPARSATKAFALAVKPLLAITTTSVTGGAVGSPYSAQLEATVDPPLTWSQTGGTLPSGINLSASGLLSGTPAGAGTFDFTVRVSSESPAQSSTRAFQIVVTSVLTITTTTAPSGTRFVPYTFTLNAAGGILPLTWTLASGTLPGGLTLSTAGVISGTPTDLGTSSFTVRVADSGGGSATRSLSISIVSGTLSITTTSIPGGVQGFPYSSLFQAAGGPTPHTWTLVSGALPSGFTLTPGGVLLGSATSPFTSTIRVRVTDSTGASDERNFSFVIGPSLGTVSLSGLTSTVSPVQQLPIVLSLASTYPAELQGTLSLSFVSTAVVPVDDPAVQFSTGGRTVTFRIPANTTNAVFSSPLQLVTGTVAGGIVITGSIQNGPSGFALSSTSVGSTPPQMTNITATRITGGLRVRVTGFSPERRVTEIEFSFEVRVSGSIQLVNLNRTVTTDFNAWYQNPASSTYGSAFLFEQLFAVAGDTSAIEAVRITLRNAQGSTTSARIPFTGN